MKIAKFTLDGFYNYGNLLQSYALQSFLEKYNCEVDTIWHSKDNFLPHILGRKWSKKEYLKLIINWKEFRSRLFNGGLVKECVRQEKLREWALRNIHIRFDFDDLSIIDKEYDFCIVGSDQVWNPTFDGYEKNFLPFISHEKRISYAASISCSVIPEEKKKIYRDELLKFAYISMREQEGADQIKEIIGKNVPVVADPTLLLTLEEWRMLSSQPDWYHGEEYILTYFLGKRPKVLASLEKETGLKVINLLDKDVYGYYVMGPDEFLWAIEHARLVYTDSFHGTVFSILFRTPFVVCNRIGRSVEEKMGSRIDTLLGYFCLEARRGTKENGYVIENPLSEPDWSQVDEVLARERKRSDEYLRQALRVGEVQDL